jgi:hypothetical protein
MYIYEYTHIHLYIGEKSTNNKNIRFKILQCAYIIKRILSILHISTILSYLSTYNAARTEVLPNEACTEVLTNDEMNGINMVNMELNDKGTIHSSIYGYIYTYVYIYVCIYIFMLYSYVYV